MTFTPDAADGEVGVTFVVPEGYAGSELVAFEWLFEGAVAGDPEDAVAEHTDIDDPPRPSPSRTCPWPSCPMSSPAPVPRSPSCCWPSPSLRWRWVPCF
ncbi:hypothetical protein KAE78_02975 [Microbacterium sp. NIBRBAC000506063]|nr:hypothetical protein KAE78_02975 [Microbacterium sp. NIBRBAC000506063]